MTINRVLNELLHNGFIAGLCPHTGTVGPDHVSGADVYDAVRSVQPLQEVRGGTRSPPENRGWVVHRKLKFSMHLVTITKTKQLTQ